MGAQNCRTFSIGSFKLVLDGLVAVTCDLANLVAPRIALVCKNQIGILAFDPLKTLGFKRCSASFGRQDTEFLPTAF